MQKREKYHKLILLLVSGIILVLVPLGVRSPYYLHLLIMTGINVVLAMTFILLLRTGLINMAIAAFQAIGAYSSTLLVMKLHMSFWFSLPASAIITGIIALCIGYLLVRNAGFGAVILTAIIGMLVPVIIGSSAALGGFLGITKIIPPDPINIPFLPPIEFVSKVSYYYLMLFLLLIVILSYSGLYAAWTGRAWMAIGLNSNLAESLGIDIFKYRLLAFVVACATAGLMGSFYAHYIGTVAPKAFGVFKTINIHVYAILGGLDFAILGPAVGSLLMTFFPEFMRITKEIEPIFTGVLLILLILFLPGGLLSLKSFWTRAVRSSPTIAESVNAVQAPIQSSGNRSNGEVMLQLRGLTKNFGGLVALEGINLHIADSEIFGLIGPNGAGKTTLINVISGFFKPNTGKVFFEGQDITGLKTHQIARLGISRSFQSSSLFMNLSALDNVFTGYHMSYRTKVWERVMRLPQALKEEKALWQRAMGILEFMGLGSFKNELAKNLPYGYQRVLGVCMALATNPRLLLLDEPMTGMNADEIETMMNLIKQIKRSGVTIVMIEHNVETVMNLCDRIVVLNYGKKIAEGAPEEIQENEEVIDAYLGKE